MEGRCNSGPSLQGTPCTMYLEMWAGEVLQSRFPEPAQGHREMTAAAAKSLQSYPTLCDPTDGSPPGSPVLGILQARTLEWVAISFSNHESEKSK